MFSSTLQLCTQNCNCQKRFFTQSEARILFSGMERFAIKIDKNLRANLYKICRLCGIDNPDKVKVLDDDTIVSLEDGEPELWKKVLDCIGVLITKDDKMPQFMCTLCVDKINDFFEFREMCYATDGQTRKLLGIKEEPKHQIPIKSSTSSIDCKTETPDIKQLSPVVSAQKTGRKRRNADMEICEIKTDEMDDDSCTTASTSTSASKKKRPKLENTEADVKSETDTRPGLSKKRLKIEATTKEKSDVKSAKASKLMQKKLKTVASAAFVKEERKPPSLQMQKKKKALELLKQRKLAKKVAVVKVEKLRKVSVDGKIKEEAAVPAPSAIPNQPKVKLKDKCAICGEGFLNKALLDKHIKNTHIPTVVRYHCVQCNETLKKNMEIKNHNLWHKLSKTPFQCGYCSESSCSIYTYSKHIRDCGQVAYLDSHIPDWHCPECSGVFETTYLFNIHSCVSNTLVCPGCDRSLKWKEDYFKHIPTCPAAVYRIPSYMSSNIQVKNEAENPTSPILLHNAHDVSSTAGGTLQPTPPSRRTPPLMDSNQCVVIPGNVNLLEEESSPSSKTGSKKSKRITKKDLKRFDKLLKSTMTTLVSIKQEPSQSDSTVDVRAVGESPTRSPSPADDDFHYNDDNDDSADEQSSLQPVGKIKQEIIDEGYRDLCTNIEVNIKHEVLVNENTNKKGATPKRKENNSIEEVAPKPVLKLKITKEHGTLNSILLDSPRSEKKKKKKKRKEDKHKAAEKKEISAVQVITDVSNFSEVAENTEVEPAMPLPEIIQIKEEITEANEGELEQHLTMQSSLGTPSIVASTSGSLQITSVSEGVHFNGAEEDEDEEEIGVEPVPTQAENVQESEAVDTPTVSEEQQEEIDIKPRLQDLIPMLRIASVSSGEDIIKNKVKLTAKRKRNQTQAPASTPCTSQIDSLSCGSQVGANQPDPERLSTGEEEESFEKVDNNENIFDYTQMRIKEEVVDPTYDNRDCNMPQEEQFGTEEVDKDVESTITEKQAEENTYIANIDFNNISIKQEKEYIDDGLDNAVAFENDDSSDSDSETSSDTGESDSESEREYRELPLEEDENDSRSIDAPVLAPLGLQILSVHSEFNTLQPDEKTESKIEGNQDKKKSDTASEIKDLVIDELQSEHHVPYEIPSGDGKEESETEVKRGSDGERKSDTALETKDLEIVEALQQSGPHIPCEVHLKESLNPNSDEGQDGSEIVVQRLSEDIKKPDTTPGTKDLEIAEAHQQGEHDVPCEIPSNESLRPNSRKEEYSKIPIAGVSHKTDQEHTHKTNFDWNCRQAIDQPSTSTTKNMEHCVDQNPTEAVSGVSVHEVQVKSIKCVSHVNRLKDQFENSVISASLGDLSKNNPEPSSSPTNATNLSCNLETNHEPILSVIDGVGACTIPQTAVKLSSPEVFSGVQHQAVDDVLSENSSEGSSRLINLQATSPTSRNVKKLDVVVENDQTATSERKTVPLTTLSTSMCAAVRGNEIHSTSNVTKYSIDEIHLSNELTDQVQPEEVLRLRTEAVLEIKNIFESNYNNTVNDKGASATTAQYNADHTPNVKDQGPSTVAEDVEVFINADTESDAINVQLSESAPDMFPTSIPQKLSDLSTYDPGPIDVLQGVVSSEPSSTSSEDQKPMKSAEFSEMQDNLKQLRSTDVQPPIQQCITECTDMPSVSECVLQNSASYASNDSIESHISSSISTEPGRHHSDRRAIPHANEISISIDLSDILSNSALHVPVAVPSSDQANEFNRSSHITAETASSIPTCSTQQQGFTTKSKCIDGNLNFTEHCSSTSSLANLPESVDLNTTAGQLHTLITPIDVQLPVMSELSSIDADLSIPVLSEEVQNLLNEDTAAATNFALNNMLRARCSTSANVYSPAAPVAVSVPNFTDLENVNEIAENNNNANIERELQDELGNVLAAAIADRSSNDEVDNNNVMNENQANFDIS